MNEARRFVTLTLTLTLAGLAVIGVLNWLVDPFQQYRLPTFYAPRFYNAQQRYVNAGLVKHDNYDRIVMGSSLMENIDNRDVDAAFAANAANSRSVNFSMSAMTAFDANQLLMQALNHGRVRNVIIHLDYNAFSGATDRSGFTAPFPSYLYDNIFINDAPYLLGADTIRKSVDILRNDHGARGARFSLDRNRPWYWADGVTFSAAKTVRNLDATNLNRQFQQPNRTLKEMTASFDRNILPLLQHVKQQNKAVQFDFVYLPYSKLVWADFAQRNQVEVTLQFREYAFIATQPYANVRWHDFQAKPEWVNDLSHYTDIYHFSPTISRAAIEAVARAEHQLTIESLTRNNTWLRHLAHTTNAAAVIEAALEGSRDVAVGAAALPNSTPSTVPLRPSPTYAPKLAPSGK